MYTNVGLLSTATMIYYVQQWRFTKYGYDGLLRTIVVVYLIQ